VAYILTGEKHAWSAEKANFIEVTPFTSLGAIELALRYSYVNLNDAISGIYGGAAEAWTIGLNWYVQPTIKFSVNYIMNSFDAHANGAGTLVGGDHYNTLAFRAQYLF
ncbi:MAG: porin, partial [Candidatus Riflemargulisbacteria bacterium]